MTAQERIEAVERLGYTKREAAFLVLVALHSGFFLSRHFHEFTGIGRRELVVFTGKLRARGDARLTVLAFQTYLFHLASKALYAALDEPDHRQPRRPVLAIKASLLGLEYILAHREYQYLATERERVDYFTSQLAVDVARLPKKVYRLPRATSVTTRYFVDRSPIAVVPSSTGEPAGVAFCYIEWALSSQEASKPTSNGTNRSSSSSRMLGSCTCQTTPGTFRLRARRSNGYGRRHHRGERPAIREFGPSCAISKSARTMRRERSISSPRPICRSSAVAEICLRNPVLTICSNDGNGTAMTPSWPRHNVKRR